MNHRGGTDNCSADNQQQIIIQIIKTNSSVNYATLLTFLNNNMLYGKNAIQKMAIFLRISIFSHKTQMLRGSGLSPFLYIVFVPALLYNILIIQRLDLHERLGSFCFRRYRLCPIRSIITYSFFLICSCYASDPPPPQ